jgi:hypothetical protein
MKLRGFSLTGASAFYREWSLTSQMLPKTDKTRGESTLSCVMDMAKLGNKRPEGLIHLLLIAHRFMLKII